jgi:hypothetical protein
MGTAEPQTSTAEQQSAGKQQGSADQDNLRTAYDQLCLSYRAIDDFRAKLLGLLPLITGGGLIVITKDVVNVRNDVFRPVGIFGALVTFGLLAYELYGIRKCHALIQAGRRLEGRMSLRAGQFIDRPRSVLGLINEPFAAAIIYPAVMAAWIFLATYSPSGSPIWPAGWVFGAGTAVILGYSSWLRRKEIKRWWRRTRWRWRRIKQRWHDRYMEGPAAAASSTDPQASDSSRESGRTGEATEIPT